MFIEIIGLIFEMIIGTIGHFLYEKSGNNKIIGFFFSKNESTWEHMKLGITPIILWTTVMLLTGDTNNLFFAKFINIIVFSFSLLILYTTLKFFIKKDILILDIVIFYLSLVIGCIVSIKIINIDNLGFFINFISLISIIFVIYLYYLFNKKTPNWFIFKIPIKR